MARIDTWNPNDGIMPTKEEQEAEANKVETAVQQSLSEQVSSVCVGCVLWSDVFIRISGVQHRHLL